MTMQAVRPLLRGPGPWDRWPWGDGAWEVPAWLYSSPEVLALERERVFAPSWNYAGLVAGVPRPGWVRSFCGDVPVVVTQDADGQIACLVNQCGHRRVEFVQETRGEGRTVVCPYHGWGYNLQGCLRRIPYRHGLEGRGGLPEGFDPAGHGLQPLHVAVRNGIIFASAGPEEDLESWLGPRMIRWLDRILPPGRELEVLGEFEQLVNADWKLFLENLKDILHAGLLHKIFSAFGLARADQPGGVETDDRWRHSVLMHFRSEGRPDARLRLQDESVFRLLPEPDDDGGPAIIMQALGSSFVVGRNQNVRHIRSWVPVRPGVSLVRWAFIGFPDDSPAMREHRILQGSAMQGTYGLVTGDDTDILERLQRGLAANPAARAVIPFGARPGGGDTHTPLTEELLRRYIGPEGWYRRQMGL